MCDVAWFDRFLALNRVENDRAVRLREYATARGGPVEFYLRRLFPRYWGLRDYVTPGFEAESVGLSRDEERQVLLDLAMQVLPPASSYTDTAVERELVLPDAVPHR